MELYEGDWTEDVPALGLDCYSLTEAEGGKDDGPDDYSEVGLDTLGEGTKEKPIDP